MSNLFPVPQPTADVVAATRIVSSANQLNKAMTANYVSSYNAVWHNPTATPEQVVAALGTNAAKVFQLSVALCTLLVQAGATDIPTSVPTGWTYVVNADGTVVLTAPATT
jgi:hypothetical protein